MALYFLGIDISKDKFDVALLPEQGNQCRQHSFPNTEQGARALLDWMGKLHVAMEEVHVCQEATSTYGLALATFLHKHGYTISIVNPFQIKHFAQSELRRAKNDKLDAAVIARFCRSHRPGYWQPVASELAELQALVRRLEALEVMRTQEMNRLQVPGTSEAVQHSIRTILGALEAEISLLKEQIHQHFERHTDLKGQRELIDSIKGIGEATATILLAEIGDHRAYASARQLAAQAGLVPTEYRSGASVQGKPQLSKQGNARIRKALYWPAIVAMRTNPLLRPVAESMLARGKPMMVVIGAIMRRLLHLVFGVLKNQRPFDPNYLPVLSGQKGG